MSGPTHSTETSLVTARGSFRVAIDGDPALPALVLSNSLGTTLEMWAPQVDAFARSHRLIRYDTRGHGGSQVTPGPYTFEALGRDVLAVMDALDIATAAFCGISMGGHTGLWLGLHAGERLDALVVCNSAARIGSEAAWNERAATVRRDGSTAMRALADSAPGRWFSADFVARQPRVVQRTQAGLATIAPEGYAACCDALARSDLRSGIGRIATPTLLVAGTFDPVTPIADAQAMQAAIPGARLATVPASHLSNLEAPEAFAQVVPPFVAAHSPR
jgi:3-oxoadipate enol-lactonase